jgi:hypothetical protein
MKYFLIPLILFSLGGFLLCSCYRTDSPHFIESFGDGASCTQDKNSLYFFKGYKIFLPPSGIARFPDGGQANVLDQGVFLYRFNKKTRSLKVLKSFEAIGWPSRWKTKVRCIGENVVFLLTPINEKYPEKTSIHGLYLSDRDLEEPILISPSAHDFQIFPMGVKSNPRILLYEKNRKTAVLFDIRSGEIVDKISSPPSIRDTWGISRTELKKTVKPRRFSHWQIPLFSVIKKSSREYQNDILTLKGNQGYRLAVLSHLKEILNSQAMEELSEKIILQKKQAEQSKKFLIRIYFEEMLELLRK